MGALDKEIKAIEQSPNEFHKLMCSLREDMKKDLSISKIFLFSMLSSDDPNAKYKSLFGTVSKGKEGFSSNIVQKPLQQFKEAVPLEAVNFMTPEEQLDLLLERHAQYYSLTQFFIQNVNFLENFLKFSLDE